MRKSRRWWAEIGDGWNDVPAGWDTAMFSIVGSLPASDYLPNVIGSRYDHW